MFLLLELPHVRPAFHKHKWAVRAGRVEKGLDYFFA
jgi:hypothetical protein